MRVSLALTPPPLLCLIPRSDTLAFDTHGDAFEHLSERLMRARPARKLAAAALSSNGTVPMLSVQARRKKSRGLSLLLRSALRSPGSVQAAKVGHEGAGVDVATGAGLPSAQADAESGRDTDDVEGGASDDDDDDADDEWSSEEEEEEEEVAEASSLSSVGTEAQCALIAKMAGVNSVQFTRFIEGNSVKSRSYGQLRMLQRTPRVVVRVRMMRDCSDSSVEATAARDHASAIQCSAPSTALPEKMNERV